MDFYHSVVLDTNGHYIIKKLPRTWSLESLNSVNYSPYANEKRDPRTSAKTEYRRSTSAGDYHKLRDYDSKDTKGNSYKLITEKNEKDFVTFCPKQRVSDDDVGIEILSCNEGVTCHLPKSTEQTKIEISDFARKGNLPETFKTREKIRLIKLNRILATAAENDPEYDTTSKVTLASDIFPNEFNRNMLEDAFSGMSELNFLDRQREFYQSIKNKTPNECKSILESKMLHDVLPLLTTALANAVAAGNHEIGTIIHCYIIDNSPKILQLFHRTNGKILQDAKVWMGTECFCNKTEEGQYEDSICNKPRPLLVVEGNDALKSLEVQEFNGFQIKVITDSSIRRNESKVAAERQLPESQQKLEKVPKSVAKLRFKRHSNLTMIRPSAFKSIGFETPDHKVLETSCISLFCHIKGIIPIGEHHFPLKIKGVPTDVLEGTSYFTSAVYIGDKIYNSKGEIGTLGGFVKYYGIDTFLTCAHVIFGKSNISNLQTKDIHFNCHTIKNDNTNEAVKCTLIRHILKYDTEETNMEEEAIESEESEGDTSIDAALVLIQMPNTLHDPVGPDSTTSCANKPVELRIKLKGYCDKTDISALGLRSIYLNENFIDTEVKHSMAIALSAITGKQESFISVNKVKKLSVIVPGGHTRIDTNILYNQFVIQNMDFIEGDSGTCIYTQFTGSEEKGCIGMLIGKSTSGECIVTPMKEILKALKVNSKS